jgi:methyl-accepting chemotaxis protein
MTKAATAILTNVFKMSEDEAKKFAPILAAVMAGPAGLILAPDLIGNAAAAIAVAAGMDPKDAQWIAMAVTLAVTIAVAVAMFVATAGMGSFDGLAKSAQVLGRIADAGGKVMTGATSIAQGINKIDVAASQKTADDAVASKKQMDAVIKKIAAQMEDEREKIKELLQNLDESMTMVSQMIASAGETRLQQSKNIV